MTLKRVGSLKNKKHKHCLQCGRVLVAPESGKIQTEQNAWGTITVTDDTGVTREYQGCIHISGTYPYETTEYMGLCVSMESAIETGEWSPGMYKLYYESEGKYWEAKNNEKESKTDE
jgi:hypothetical protein